MAALEDNDDLDYATAFFSKDVSTMKVATEIEDLIFDYFGIVEMQFEAANQFFKGDPEFKEAKAKLQTETRLIVNEEYGFDEQDEALKKLDKKTAT